MSTSYDYYRNVLTAIDLISQGRTRTRACDDARVSIPVFLQYVNKQPELRDLLEEAETRGYDAMADALLEIDNHPIYGQSDAKMAKVISDNIKWLLSKRKVKDYGDRVTVDVNITADRAITEALMAGRARVSQALLAPPDAAIDADFTVVDEDERLLAELLA